jgi:hypothetical protein
MNTNHTTRTTAVRTSALTVALTALLLGAPAIASAAPHYNTPVPVYPVLTDTPAPPPPPGSTVAKACLSCTVNTPALPTPVRNDPITRTRLTSNSGPMPAGTITRLSISGDYWIPGDAIRVSVISASGAIEWSGSAVAGSQATGGHWDASTGCQTIALLDGNHDLATAADTTHPGAAVTLPVTLARDINSGAPLC